MDVTTIINARLRQREGLWTLRLERGRIADLSAQGTTPAPGPGVIDAAGGLVTPALVDAHVHLDLAHSLELVPPNQSGTLVEAIRLWEQVKPTLTAENTQARAERALRAEVGYGTGFLRSHVDVASSAGLRLFEGVRAAAAAWRHACKVELVAFPQDGLIRDPAAVENMRESLRHGADLVGGIPHVERTQREGLRHLDLVFDLADEFQARIDVHIDETDDPQSLYVEHLASLTIERGWQSRVTASHVCALSSYDDVHAAKVVDLIAEAGIHVVTNPGVNLHLQGRFDGYPKRRGLTRVSQLIDAGVRCAAGQDCINDPFYPLGNGKLLEQVFLLIHADHMSSPERMRQAAETVCCMAGEVLGLGTHRVEVGAPANLLVHPLPDMLEIIRLRPSPRAVLHDARLVAQDGAVIPQSS